ncbi:hypothetical protein BG003_005982 [Podila horticola]|nr:hypothetical protein BG003_005982 [Podila horticola]
MQLPKDPYTTDDTNYNNDTNNDSTATTPHTDYDTHAYPKNIFYDTPTREQESDIAHDYSVEGHVRTWSFQDTLTNSDHGDDEGEDKEEEPATMTSLVITSDQLVLSSSKDIIPADAPSENGDMLEHLVQRLQSEVADTRAIVQDLESRLNAAENSNRHIVQELKVLLADAEGTLVGSDDSDSESSAVVSPKHGSSEEDSNVVYNRICHALQSLITEAQSALMRKKQQEQYDRYRRSCDMVSLELQLLLNDSAFDSDQSDTSALSSSSTKANSSGHTASSTTTPRSAVSSHKRSKDGTESKAEKLQRRYQVQFLNPNIQRRQRDGGSYKPRDRHYKNQGVGASRSQSILMQLYDLWKHTWLRNRFMHVLTSSVEVLVILLIVIKVSQVSLTWMGVSLDKSQNLLTYIYGHRQGAGAAAKELYGKIRRDGLRFTQIRLRQLYPETEALVQDMLLGDKPPTPFTPAGMVLGPAKRMLAHTVAGVALAYVSENARHVAMML